MPRFVGSAAPEGAHELPNNATENSAGPGMVRITYAQMIRLAPETVWYSLDTTDRGGIRTMAKRWYRWFAPASVIQASPRATAAMLRRAV